MEISSTLISCDQTCDYIPVVSSLTNLAILFQKYYKGSGDYTRAPLRFERHLESKPTKRCLLLLIPFLGNFLVYQEDVKKAARQKEALSLCCTSIGHVPKEVERLEKESANSAEWPATLNPLLQHEEFILDCLKDAPNEFLQRSLSELHSVRKEAFEKWDKRFLEEASSLEREQLASLSSYREKLLEALTCYEEDSSETTWERFLPDLLLLHNEFPREESLSSYLEFHRKIVLEREEQLITLREQSYKSSIADKTREEKLNSLLTACVCSRFPSLNLLKDTSYLLDTMKTLSPETPFSLEDISLETRISFLEKTLQLLQDHPPIGLIEIRATLSLLTTKAKMN